jgi:magnesium transporter
MIVDNAIYVDGRRVAEPSSLQETYEACREQRGLAWIGLHEPTEEEFSSVAQEFGLHPLAVEDAVKAHQRPKLERYDETLFVVLRPARYIDETETVEFGDHGPPWRGVRAREGAQTARRRARPLAAGA